MINHLIPLLALLPSVVGEVVARGMMPLESIPTAGGPDVLPIPIPEPDPQPPEPDPTPQPSSLPPAPEPAPAFSLNLFPYVRRGVFAMFHNC